MVRRLTHEEFMKKFYEKNKNAENIEILGEYVNNATKIKVKCKIDGYEWEVVPNSLLKGYGCPKCSGNAKLTHEEFMEKFYKQNKNAENIEILGEYKTSYTKIKCKCKIDGHEWEATPHNLLNGNGCPKCSGNAKLTHEEFMKKFYEKNKNAENIEILGEYVNSSTKIKCRCRKDGHEWEVKPNDLLKGYGCPKCKKGKTHEQFMKDFYIKNKNAKNIEILGIYESAITKIKCKCKLDNNIWYTTPHGLLDDNGCPKCNASKGESEISRYLDNRNINYIPQHKFNDCRSKDKLPFDFYIPSLNIAIEYDGKQHYEIIDYFGGLDGFIYTKIHDTIKTIYCKENNIKLIRIPYTEYDNIEKILEKELL